MIPDVPLGRLTEETKELWGTSGQYFPRAPRWKCFAVAETPDLTRFDPGYDGLVQAENAEDYYQDRGFCVGWSLASLFWYTSALPAIIKPWSRRMRPERTSPLYAYMLARWGMAKKNMRISGDGAIVALAVLEAGAGGMLSWSEMPCTTEIETAHSNKRMPTEAELAAGAKRAPSTVAVIDNRQQIDEYLDGGYVVNVGTSWTTGLSRPDKNGNISSVGGSSLGGHAYLIFAAGPNRLGLKNSHPMYGVRSKDARYQASDGWTNIAYCDRASYLSAFFKPTYLKTGESESAVIAGTAGFVPRIEI